MGTLVPCLAIGCLVVRTNGRANQSDAKESDVMEELIKS